MKLKKRLALFLSVIMVLSVVTPLSAFAEEAGSLPVISIKSVNDTAGAVVDVIVEITHNTGILGATLGFTYDSGLTLLNATEGEAFSALTMTKPGKFVSPCRFVWDGQEITQKDIKDGTILTLQFKIDENAESGDAYNITMSYKKGDVLDADLNSIDVKLVNGSVGVVDFLPGDLDGNRVVNTRDIVLLRRDIAGGYEQTVNTAAGDVDNNGERNTRDIILVRRYVAGGYGVELVPSKPQCEHNMAAIEYSAPTCTKDGNIAYWHCTKCDRYFSDEDGRTPINIKDTVISAAGHIAVVDARVEPTDTTPGKTEGKHCSVCNEILVKQDTIPPLKDEFTIQYACDMVPQAADTYKSSEGKVLPKPVLDKYTFVGWSDKQGKIWNEIPVGTTGNITLYANWVSDRNKAEKVNNLSDPIIWENTTKGLILFAYEIGQIKNVPLYTTLQLQCANGLISTVSMTNQKTISATDAKTVAKKVSNATTNSSTWTLSSNWNNSTEISQSYLDQTGLSRTEAESIAKSKSNTYSATVSSGGSSTTTDSSNSTINLTGNKAHADTETTEKGQNFELSVNGKYSTEASVGVPIKGINVGAKAGIEVGGGVDYSNYRKTTNTGTDSWSNTVSASGGNSHTTVDASTWNSSSGRTSSNSVSSNQTVSNAISQLVSQQYGYGQSYSQGGSNSQSQEFASTNTSSDEYGSTLTYFSSEIKTTTTSFSSTGNTHGNYRMVMAGNLHVFAVVGYDVAKNEYFTYTYNVLDDSTHEYLDYSYDGTFNDYETSVLPFEVPYFVNEYVIARTAKTDGLTIDLDTGIVEDYTPNKNNPDNMIVIPSYVRVDNNDGTFSAVKIKGICPGLFKDNTDIVGVSLSSFIDEIPEAAFEGCTSLKEVICPNVTKIADNAFNGCTSLSDFTISENIKEIGTNAFKGVPTVKSIASSAQVAQAIASCGADRISLDISAIPESESANMLFCIGEITSFELQGKDKEYKGLGIKSDAAATIINGVTFTENTQIPMELSSDTVTLDRVTVDCSGYALVLKAADTSLVLNRTVNLISDSENTVLCKNISLSNLNSSVVGKLNVNGNLLINGSITNDKYITVSDGKIIYISDEDFENYLGIHSVYFDANGGTVDTEYITIPYNSTFGELPNPSRDLYLFDGWYTEASGGEKITQDSIMTSPTDITLYAHWKVEVGDRVTFGKYEQDNDVSNGKEAIEWRVLDKLDGKIFIISTKILDYHPFHYSKGPATWETCSLRGWFNSTFIADAFSSSEKSRISVTPHGTVSDKIFLLSTEEVEKYYDSPRAYATKYAIARGVYDPQTVYCNPWILRSNRKSDYYCAYVEPSGYIDKVEIDDGVSVWGEPAGNAGIRPAMNVYID